MANFKSVGDITDAIKQSYNTSSGCDIIATIDGILIGNLNGISFSTTREKAPVYTMGSVDAVSFVRGKRGHAGSLIFTNFDRHALYDIMDPDATTINGSERKRYYYWKKQQDVPAGGRSKLLSTDFSDLSALGITLAPPSYSDQIPPFTITLTSMTEYGSISVMNILGVELINEGSGVSIDDIVTETQMTFVARAILGWKPIQIGTAASAAGSYNIQNSTILERLNSLTEVQQAQDFQTLAGGTAG